MKKLFIILCLVLSVWIVQLRDGPRGEPGKKYQGIGLSSGNNGVTLTMEDKTKITFPWAVIQSITEQNWRK